MSVPTKALARFVPIPCGSTKSSVALQVTTWAATSLAAAVCVSASLVTLLGLHTALDTASRPMGRVFKMAGVTGALGVACPSAALAHLAFAETSHLRSHVARVASHIGHVSDFVRTDAKTSAAALKDHGLKRVALLLLWTQVMRPAGAGMLFAEPPSVGNIELACYQLLGGIYFALFVTATLVMREQVLQPSRL